ncbi:terpene synthase family protein [Spongiactinospora sp. TRM90649]|uniref:terpene synthase family protein n=1 Tax=Spongiactinospora sp. TRM90649 TaxID=3031114 RepID=UPI0023F892BC|nr:terpene synthase family protein [Spongiactinospora sp. TRM90649]MDF5758973.1 terpene synthase family protein [Spongiactinospora sp. TRM90649]
MREIDRMLSSSWHPLTPKWDAFAEDWTEELLGELSGGDRAILETTLRDGIWWACVCYPAADDTRMHDVARAAVAHIVLDDCIYTSYLTDGRMDELLADFAAAVNDPEEERSTFIGRFMASAWRAMCPRMPDGLRDRLAAATNAYVRSTAVEVEARASGETFTRDEYMAMREGSMAADVVHYLGEYSIDIDMSADMERLPELFAQVRRVGCAHFAYVNDLLTFRKEYCDGGDFQHSLVYTAVTDDGLTLQQSVDRLCDLIEKTERRYRDLTERILAATEGEQRERMRVYLRQVERGLAGSLDYSQVGSRYHGQGFSRLEGFRFVPSRTTGWLELSPGKSVFHDAPV